jgi:hypothetical protein
MASGELWSYMTACVLTTFMESRRTKKFSWGQHDCAMLAFDAVFAMTGKDPANDLRGTYNCARSATEIASKAGGLGHILDARIGRRLPISAVASGDILQISRGHCVGSLKSFGAVGVAFQGEVVCQGEDGLVTVPMSEAISAWRPGRG